MSASIPASDLHMIPQPWAHNPSSWSQRLKVSLFAGIAFLIAAYMGLYQWRLIDSVWDPVFGGHSSRAVLDSSVSHWIHGLARIPDSVLGALAYLGDILFALSGSTRRWQYRPWLVLLFGLDVIPLGLVSAILVAMQGFVVGAWCFLCLVTAAISLILIALAYDEVWSCLIYLYRVYQRRPGLAVMWNTFWGRPSPIAFEVGEALTRRP